MGLFDMFKKKKEPEGPAFDPLRDMVLAKLKVGYFVDYEGESYEVVSYNEYEYGPVRNQEWGLRASSETMYLERSTEDGVSWSLSHPINIGDIQEDIRGMVIKEKDPLDRIHYDGKRYTMSDASAGYLRKDGSARNRQEFLSWFFMDEDEETFVSVMQWSGRQVEAVSGHFVEEYQFSNILPGQGT